MTETSKARHAITQKEFEMEKKEREELEKMRKSIDKMFEEPQTPPPPPEKRINA